MERITYTPSQIKALLTNPNVERASRKSITYSKEFKVKAVKEYRDLGLGSSTIFQNAGFDMETIGKEKAKSCLKRWNRTCKGKGEGGLRVEGRGRSGGRRKAGALNDPDYLKAKIAYLESENAFLRKLKTKTKS